MEEQRYRDRRGGKMVRPFSIAARVSSRGMSLGLERVLTDFGADSSFAKAVVKVKEHYGVEVNESAVCRMSEKHGDLMHREMEVEPRMPAKGVKELLAETDGAFIPIVEIVAGFGDKRKRRSSKYQEGRLCLAGQVGSFQRKYRATLGSVDEAGRQWKASVVEAGGGENTALHCVGDGAPWIVKQMEKQFGKQAKYLIDFYHLSEYLGKAGEAIGGKEGKRWLKKAQAKMKNNEWQEVLQELGKYEEAKEIAEVDAPVRSCRRYMENRKENLDYRGAIEKGLPIGSGEIESGNKSVVQARLKIAGAWWKVENAEKMLALRVNRANGDWNSYWKQQRQANA